MSKYGISKKVELSFDEAVEKVTETLMNEGFGVLTTIDVKATLKKKLDKDIDAYTILGACNAPFASVALEVEQEIGLLLPCNVIVYVKNGSIFVSAINPSVAMSFVDNPKLKEIAEAVEAKLQIAIDKV